MKIGTIRTAQTKLRMKERALQLLSENKKPREVRQILSTEFLYSQQTISRYISPNKLAKQIREDKRKILLAKTLAAVEASNKPKRKQKQSTKLF